VRWEHPNREVVGIEDRPDDQFTTRRSLRTINEKVDRFCKQVVTIERNELGKVFVCARRNVLVDIWECWVDGPAFRRTTNDQPRPNPS
jgi:hypothetical protein